MRLYTRVCVSIVGVVAEKSRWCLVGHICWGIKNKDVDRPKVASQSVSTLCCHDSLQF